MNSKNQKLLSTNKLLFKELYKIKNNWNNVLYIHNPFCVHKCKYCVYNSFVPESQKQVKEFYELILQNEIKEFLNVFEALTFQEVYLGGGTPTYLKAGDIEKYIYNKIPNFNKIPLKATEASPYTISKGHIDLFEQYKFNYVSIGVQSTQKKILEKQNRQYVNIDKIADICELLKKANIIVNIDLIFFLETGTLIDLDSAYNDLLITMETIAPTSITIHSNYIYSDNFSKRYEMIKLIKSAIRDYNYKPVNSLLSTSSDQVKLDLQFSSEYRVMNDSYNFNFYMMPQYAQPYRFGYNMLGIGEYQNFKVRSNFFYIFNNYTSMQKFDLLEFITLDYLEIRQKLGLSVAEYIDRNSFFRNKDEEKNFSLLIKEYLNPFYE